MLNLRTNHFALVLKKMFACAPYENSLTRFFVSIKKIIVNIILRNNFQEVTYYRV